MVGVVPKPERIVTTVLARYGIVAVPAVMVTGLLIWALAHFTASPGSPVSVLWGMVEYTKRPSDEMRGRSDAAARSEVVPGRGDDEPVLQSAVPYPIGLSEVRIGSDAALILQAWPSAEFSSTWGPAYVVALQHPQFSGLRFSVERIEGSNQS